MFCPGCGTQVQDGVKFCFSCGKPVTGSAPGSAGSGGAKETPDSPDSLDVGDTLTPELADRTVLRSKYEVQRELGRGGMGVVYLAHDLDLQPSSSRYAVAVKMLPPALGRDERWMKRLMAEFDAAAQLRSPHIVLVYSFSVDDRTGAPFIVMEYVEGASLDRVLDTRGRLDEEETLALADAVAKGLGEAHERGLVHRDFKPGNVLVPFEGGPAAAKVSDFGLARMVQSGVTRLTGRGAPSGTLLYNSPEQHRGSRRLDGRSDLYSFAATLYECLAGESVVNPEGDIGWQVTQEAPEPLEDVSPPIFAAILKALAKDKEERFETVAAFVEALRGGGPAACAATSVEGRALRRAQSLTAPSRPAVAVRDTQGPRGRDGARPSIVLPRGWTSEDRRIAVATPEGDLQKDITYYRNPIGMEFVLVPAGEFMMGSPEDEEGRYDNEGPAHKVRIARPFFLGATPVTQRQYREVTGENRSHFRGERVVSKGFFGIGRKTEPEDLPDRPVEMVSWDDTQEFIKNLCGSDGGDYRLPTEAEWEYACRAESRTRFYSGDADSALGRIGWYRGNSGHETHEVGQKLPNAFGLYDMSGNVWEWCQDWYDSGYYAESPPEAPGPGSGSWRVNRGGDWSGWSRYFRSANRAWSGPVRRFRELGFRLART